MMMMMIPLDGIYLLFLFTFFIRKSLYLSILVSTIKSLKKNKVVTVCLSVPEGEACLLGRIWALLQYLVV